MTQVCGSNWSGDQLCNNPIYTSGQGIDDDNDDDDDVGIEIPVLFCVNSWRYIFAK